MKTLVFTKTGNRYYSSIKTSGNRLKILILIFFLFVIVRSFSFSQDQPVDYFPLKVGNQWTYITLDMGGIYYYSTVIEILKTELINDTLYYVFSPGTYPLSNRYRKDSVGNIYERYQDQDHLLYKVTAKVGEKWNFIYKSSVLNIDEISLLLKYNEYTEPAGVFKNCLEFYEKAQHPEGRDHYTILAPAIGIIDRQSPAGWKYLKKAKINDQIVSAGIFQISSQYPSPGSSNDSMLSPIQIKFNSILSDTIPDSLYTVYSTKKGKLKGTLYYLFMYKYITFRRYIFQPDSTLPDNDHITVKISALLKDIYGDHLDGNYNWKYDGSPFDDYQWEFYIGKPTDVQRTQNNITDFQIFQNYPNPFNSSTIIEYIIPSEGFVNAEVYNILGQKVKTLLSKEQNQGTYHEIWDGKDDYGNSVNSGIYIFSVRWNNKIKTTRSLYLK